MAVDDKEMVKRAKSIARTIGPGTPAGALGNTPTMGPDFEKAKLPSDSTRPNFKRGGKVKAVSNFCKGGKVISSHGR